MKEKIPLRKQEINDWTLAKEVRTLMSKQKLTYHQACDFVLDKYKVFDVEARISCKRKIGKICGEISGKARKKIEPVKPLAEKSEEAAPQISYWEELKRRDLEKEKEKTPLFADQIEEEEQKRISKF